jgi:hypothetical protein
MKTDEAAKGTALPLRDFRQARIHRISFVVGALASFVKRFPEGALA